MSKQWLYFSIPACNAGFHLAIFGRYIRSNWFEFVATIHDGRSQEDKGCWFVDLFVNAIWPFPGVFFRSIQGINCILLALIFLWFYVALVYLVCELFTSWCYWCWFGLDGHPSWPYGGTLLKFLSLQKSIYLRLVENNRGTTFMQILCIVIITVEPVFY